MTYSTKPTKEDIELETLKTFLINNGEEFSKTLVDSNKSEPTDIRYDNINYQITLGDKEVVEETRKGESKSRIYTSIRNTADIILLLLDGTLTKKSLRADSNTILLLEVSSTGNNTWDELTARASKWAKEHTEKCKVWKEIYLVYSDKNIKVEY